MPRVFASGSRNVRAAAIDKALLSNTMARIPDDALGCRPSVACLPLAAYELRQKDYAGAERILQDLIASQGAGGPKLAWFRLGQVQSAQGKMSQALASWRRGEAAPYFENLALAAFDDGEYEAAVEFFELSLAVDGTKATAHRELAQTLLRLEREEEALQHLHMALNYADGDPETYRLLGDTYWRLNQYEKALHYLQTAAQLRPTPRTYLLMGRVYSHQGHPSRAVPYFRRAAESAQGDERTAGFRWTLAKTLFEAGFVADAVREGEESLAVEDDPERRQTLKQWLSVLNDE